MTLIKKYNEIGNLISEEDNSLVENIDGISDLISNTLNDSKGRIFFIAIGSLAAMIGSTYWDLEKNLDLDTKRVIVISAIQTWKNEREDWNSLIAHKQMAPIELEEFELSADDVVVCMTSSNASGYIHGAKTYARETGAKVISITNNNDIEEPIENDFRIVVPIGEYYINNLRAFEGATSLKMMFDILMIEVAKKMGKIYNGWNVAMKWEKATKREDVVKMISSITNASMEESEELLEKANDDQLIAMLMKLNNQSVDEAIHTLKINNGNFVKSIN